MTVTAGVAAIQGPTRSLYAVRPRRSRVAGDEAPGRRCPGHHRRDRGRVVRAAGDGATQIAYEADATWAGWSAVSASGCSGRCRSGWPASSSATSGSRCPASAAACRCCRAGDAVGVGAPLPSRVCSPRPAKAGGISSQDDFLKGIAVGAGLVLAGVIVGGRSGGGGEAGGRWFSPGSPGKPAHPTGCNPWEATASRAMCDRSD